VGLLSLHKLVCPDYHRSCISGEVYFHDKSQTNRDDIGLVVNGWLIRKDGNPCYLLVMLSSTAIYRGGLLSHTIIALGKGVKAKPSCYVLIANGCVWPNVKETDELSLGHEKDKLFLGHEREKVQKFQAFRLKRANCF